MDRRFFKTLTQVLLLACLFGAYASAARHHAETGEPLASRWGMDPASLDAEMTISNGGTESTAVWLMQKDAAGKIVAAQQFGELAPGERITVRPDQSRFSAELAGSLELNATQYLTLSVAGPTGKVAGAKALGDAVTERNERGIWFITGGDLYDIHEMMGYNVAQDRFWQLTLYRRIGHGRLAEWYGPDFLGQDIQTRTMGYSQEELQTYYTALDEESRTMLDAYAAGINRRLAELAADPSQMPAELILLGATPEPFQPTDLMAFATVLQRSFSLPNLFGQVNNALMLQTLTATRPLYVAVAMFLDAVWMNDPAAMTMIPQAAGKKARNTVEPMPLVGSHGGVSLDELADVAVRLNEEQKQNRELLESVGAYLKGGSFAWVVSGDKTDTGNPIIYSGPQMGFNTPNVVSEGSIVSDVVEVSGMHVPMVPSIIVGRTPHHAWSFQVGHTHTADFYIEQEADVYVNRVETFNVRGQDPVQVPIMFGQHGPILVSEPFFLSLKYSHRGYEWAFGPGSLNLARAQNMEEFGAAVAQVGASQHICYADVDGNIAYWMSGRNPVRPPGDYRFPQGLFGPPAEYDIAVVHDPPHASNPAQGWFGGWNNKSDPNLPDLTGSQRYGLAHRAIEVQGYLASKDRFTYEELNDLATRVVMTDSFMFGGNPWKFVDEAFTAIARANPTPERLAAVEVMDAWDGFFAPGGPEGWLSSPDRADGWVLAENWILKAIELTFADDIDPSFGLSEEDLLNLLVRELNPAASRPNYYRLWFRNLSDPSAPQTRDDVILAALDQTLAELGERPWGTGLRGEISFDHPLFGQLVSVPYARHATYAQIVEMSPAGPSRIASKFAVGQISQVGVTATGDLEFHPLYFALHPFFSHLHTGTVPDLPGHGCRSKGQTLTRSG